MNGIKKTLIVVFITAFMLGLAAYFVQGAIQRGNETEKLLPNPPENTTTEQTEEISFPSIFQKDPVINILLIGTDTSLERRNNGIYGYNTDATILLSMDTITKQVVLTSVPRDMWVNGNKINSLFVLSGWEGLKNAYEEITGLKIDGYVTTDFDGFRWLVSQMGGVNVEVKKTFTDYTFPNLQDNDIMEVSFVAGEEVMDGERALTYARSRKGTNGEGSDLMRAKRQHLILEGIVSSFENPLNNFKSLDIKGFYETVIKHMETSLTLDDAIYLWDFYAYRDEYSVQSFVLDDTYLYHPGVYPASSYTAWVFLPKDPTYSDIHEALESKLAGETSTEAQQVTSEAVTTE